MEQSQALVAAAAHRAGTHIPDQASRLPRSATDKDRAAATTILYAAGLLPGERLVVVHPGSGAAIKSWPLERFVQTGAAVGRSLDARVVVTGSPGEHPLAEQVCSLIPGSLNLAGLLSWRQLEAVLARAELVVGVDSGPLHLAVAAGTPSVALFGPADPAQFAPWGPAEMHRVVTAQLPCRPCRRLDICVLEPGQHGPPPCMRGIEAQVVLEASLEAVTQREADHAAPQ